MMASHVPEVVKITPTPESLVISHSKDHGDYKCSEDQCSFKTSSPSMLGLHKAQAHRITTAAKKGTIHQYFCPASGCYYNLQSGRSFKTLDILRTHYMKVHHEKKFKCAKCDKAFGLERDCLYHEKECGKTFSCPECEKTYNNKNALNMHCMAKGHQKPPELCPKPKTPKTSPLRNKPKRDKGHLTPILPKFSSLDKVSFLLPTIKNGFINSCKPGLPSVSPVKVLLHSNQSQMTDISKFNLSSPLTFISSQKSFCDNGAQTVKSLSSASSQTTVKCHAPTQTKLSSILEKAMKSSKIPVTKKSKGTQKSYSYSCPRKRKNANKQEPNHKKSKSTSKMTVATLTDPLSSLTYEGNFRPLFATYQNENQFLTMPVNTAEIHNNNSMLNQERSLSVNQSQPNDHTSPQYFASPLITTSHHDSMASFNSSDHNSMTTDSITQTFGPWVTEMTKSHVSHSETQTTNLKESSSSKTQTQEILALDSSTQTLQLNPHFDNTSDFLNDLLDENDRNHVNTQTIDCVFSDMMTQTLEELASDTMSENVDNSSYHDFGVNTTTQTFDDMTNDITALTNSVPPMTFRNEMMTQTLEPLAYPSTVDNIDNIQAMVGCGINNITTQTMEETVDNITQTFDTPIVDCMTQTSFGNDIMTQTFNDFGVDMMTQTFDLYDFDNSTQLFSLQHSDPRNKTENGDIESNETGVQTAFLGGRDITTQTSDKYDRSSETRPSSDAFTQILNFTDVFNESVLDSVSTQVNEISENSLGTSQTLSTGTQMQGDFNSTLIDTTTQTFYTLPDDISTHVFDSSVTNSMTQTLSIQDDDLNLETLLSDMATQTFENEDISFSDLLPPSDESSTNFMSRNTAIFADSACQTPFTVSSESQISNGVFNFEDQNYNGGSVWEMGTQRVGDISWEIATQTGNEDLWERETQTGENPTQTMVNDIWETGTQTGDLWEAETQTGLGNLETVGIQTMGNDIWDMGTQTGGDDIWEMGTQTWGDDLWEMGTQTGGDNLWENGTQTGDDNLWENATQTGGDDLWENGTQTGGDNLWENGTQTGGDNFWEMGTQTGMDDLWEMGTQTMDSLLTNTMTQTGDDLLDFLSSDRNFEVSNIKMNSTQTDSFQENNETQTSAAISFTDQDLFDTS